MITQSLFKKTTAVLTAIAMFSTMFIGAVPIRVAEAIPLKKIITYSVQCTVKVQNSPVSFTVPVSEDQLDNVFSDRKYNSVQSLRYQVGAAVKTVQDNDANDVDKASGRIQSAELKAWVDEEGRFHIKTVMYKPSSPGNDNFKFTYEVGGKGTWDGKARVEYDLALIGTHYEPGTTLQATYGVSKGLDVFNPSTTRTFRISLDNEGLPREYIIDKGRLAPIYDKTIFRCDGVYPVGQAYFGMGYGEEMLADDVPDLSWREIRYADGLRTLLITQYATYRLFAGTTRYRAKYTVFTCKPVESILHEHELDERGNKVTADGKYIDLPDSYYRYQSKGSFLIKSRTNMMQIGYDPYNWDEMCLEEYDADMKLELEEPFSYPMDVGTYRTDPRFDRMHGWENEDKEKGFRYRLKLKITPFGGEEPLPDKTVERTVYLKPGETTDIKNIANMNLTFLLREDGNEYDGWMTKLFVSALPAKPEEDKYEETHTFGFPEDLPEGYEYTTVIGDSWLSPISDPMDFLAGRCKDAEYHLKSLTLAGVKVEDNSELDIDKRDNIIDINGLVIHLDGEESRVYACKRNLVPQAKIISYTTESIEGTEVTLNTSDPSFTEPVFAKSDKPVIIRGQGTPSVPDATIEEHRMTSHLEPYMWLIIEKSEDNPNEADIILNSLERDQMKSGVHKLFYRVSQSQGAWSPNAIGLLRINQPPMVYVKEIDGAKLDWEGFYATAVNKPVKIRVEALSPDGDEIEQYQWFKYDFEKLEAKEEDDDSENSSEELKDAYMEDYGDDSLIPISNEDTTDEYVISPDGKELTFTPKTEGRYGIGFKARDSAGEWSRGSQSVRLDFKVSKVPVLLIHGYLSSPIQMDRIKKRLEDIYEVATVDLQVKNFLNIAKTFGFNWERRDPDAGGWKEAIGAFLDALKSMRSGLQFSENGLYNFFLGDGDDDWTDGSTWSSGFEFTINDVPINMADVLGVACRKDDAEIEQEIEDKYAKYRNDIERVLQDSKLLKVANIEEEIDSEAKVEKIPNVDREKYKAALMNVMRKEERKYRDLVEDALRNLKWLSGKEITYDAGKGNAVRKILEYLENYGSIEPSINKAVNTYVEAMNITGDSQQDQTSFFNRKVQLIATLSGIFDTQIENTMRFVDEYLLEVYKAEEIALEKNIQTTKKNEAAQRATELFLKTFGDYTKSSASVGKDMPEKFSQGGDLPADVAAMVCRFDVYYLWDMCFRGIAENRVRKKIERGKQAAEREKANVREEVRDLEDNYEKQLNKVEELRQQLADCQRIEYSQSAVTKIQAKEALDYSELMVVTEILEEPDANKLESVYKKAKPTQAEEKFINNMIERLNGYIGATRPKLGGKTSDQLARELADAEDELEKLQQKLEAKGNLQKAYDEYIDMQNNILVVSPEQAGNMLRNRLKWNLGWFDFGNKITLNFSLIPTNNPIIAEIVSAVLNWLFNDIQILTFNININHYQCIPLGKYNKIHMVLKGKIPVGLGDVKFTREKTSFTIGAGLNIGVDQLYVDLEKEFINSLLDNTEWVDSMDAALGGIGLEFVSDDRAYDIHYCALDERSMTAFPMLAAAETSNEESVFIATDRLAKFIRIIIAIGSGARRRIDLVKLLSRKDAIESEETKDKGENAFYIEPEASITVEGFFTPVEVNFGLRIGARIAFMKLANGRIGEYKATVSEAVEELCNKTGLEKVNIIGNNMGGLIARDYAKSASHRVDKVILIGTPNYGFSWAKYSVAIFDFIIGLLNIVSIATGGSTSFLTKILSLVKQAVQAVLGPARVDMCPHSAFITGLNGCSDCEARKRIGGGSVYLAPGVQHHNIYGNMGGWPLTLTHFHIEILGVDIELPWLTDGDLVVAKSAAHVENMRNYTVRGTFGSLAKESSVINKIVEILDGKHDYTPWGTTSRNVTEGVNLASADESDILAVLAQADPWMQDGNLYQEEVIEVEGGLLSSSTPGYPYQEVEVAQDVMAEGDKHTNIYKVDSSIKRLIITQRMLVGDAHLTVVAPDGTQIMSENYSPCDWATYYKDEDSGETKVFITEPQVGDWKLITEAKNGSACYSITAGYGTDMSVVLGSAKNIYEPEDTVNLCAYAFRFTGGTTDIIKDVESIAATVVMPNGRTEEGLELRDDGMCGDGSAGDGVFGLKFDNTKREGMYQVIVEARIVDGDTEHERQATYSFEVARIPNLRILGSDISFEKGGAPIDKNNIDEGGTVQIKAKIKNEGDKGANAKGVRINFYEGKLGDSKTSLIGTDTVNVEAGSYSTAMVRWNPKHGVRFITVQIDLIGQPIQKDPRDKIAETEVVVNKATRVDVNLPDMLVLKSMPVTFDGTKVRVNDEDLVYDWDLDVDNHEGLPEGQRYKTGKIVVLPEGYTKTDKPYRVKLTIRRGDTVMGEGLLNVVVKDELEGTIIANAGRDISVRIGEDVRFDGSMSKSPFTITQYVWDVDMGSGRAPKQLVGIAPVLEGGFSEPGKYTVKLTVNDLVGNGPAVDEVVVTVLEPAIRVGSDTVTPAGATGDEVTQIVLPSSDGSDTVTPTEIVLDQPSCVTIMVKEGEKLSVPVMVVNPPMGTIMYLSGEPEFVQLEDRGGGRGVLMIEPKISENNSPSYMFELSSSGMKGSRMSIWVNLIVDKVKSAVPIQMVQE